MSESKIDERTREFLLNEVGAVDVLEILLFLHKHPDTDFSAETVFQQVQTSHTAVSARLEMLNGKGLAQEKGGRPSPKYRADLSDPERTEMIARLSRLYNTRRVSIIETLYAPSTSVVEEARTAPRVKRERGGTT